MKKLVLTMFLLFAVVQKTTSNSYGFNNVKEFTEENLVQYMNDIGILYADVVLAQAKIETGNFTSVIFRENNNLFGMKLAKVRTTTAIGKSRNHAKYRNWMQSVYDYKLWQDRMIHRGSTKRKYLEYLSRNYAEDKTYIRKIKKLL